eukprot:CAMPEP_0185753750 /NCGR_PEP_ID=MMETSP1174-20130828/12461_1 /TAXON_ID=35687 /ORGANISM="Dictyocha speculum, Strain CCMP1381" /LENGTH=529 /DNA_ID=CAMNT_0028431729 /DNA_START=66 /DNA_END=1655 /DNA_ORIENTATION=-
MELRGVLWLLVSQCSALAPLTVVRPVVMHRSPSIRLALQTDDEHEYPSQQDEIVALKAKLREAEATIARLSSSKDGGSPVSLDSDEATTFDDSRFPLFRKVQSQALSALGKFRGEDEVTTLPETERNHHASDGQLAYLAAEETIAKGASEASVEIYADKIFHKYDADNSGQIDITIFRQFLQDASRGVVEATPSFSSEWSDFSEWSKETYSTAETMYNDAETMAYETAEKTADSIKDTAKSVVDAVNDAETMAYETAEKTADSIKDTAKSVVDAFSAVAASGIPGPAAAPSVPLTLVGGVGSGYMKIIAAGQLAQVPVIELTEAIERQAALSTQLGGFMQLIVKLDQANMRTVRLAWEKHGRPVTVRELLEAEVAAGVQEPTRLTEGSAALSLLWSMRAKRFWTIVADGFADQESKEMSSAFGLRAYAAELEPYHGFLLRNTFRPGLLALPSRKEMLGKMASAPTNSMALDTPWPGWKETAAAGESLTSEERMAACLVELRECSDATKSVTNAVQAQLDELGLRDDRKL